MDAVPSLKVLEAVTRAKRTARHTRLLKEALRPFSWRAGVRLITALLSFVAAYLSPPSSPLQFLLLFLGVALYTESQFHVLECQLAALWELLAERDGPTAV